MNELAPLFDLLQRTDYGVIVSNIALGYVIKHSAVPNKHIESIVLLWSLLITSFLIDIPIMAFIYGPVYAVISFKLYDWVMIKIEKVASKSQEPDPTAPRLYLVPVLALLMLGLSGCATIAPNSASLPKDASKAEKDAAIALDVERALPGIQTASSLICTAVLVGALDEGDAADKAKAINLAASVFASLEGTESAEDIKANLLMVLPNKPHWRNLAGSLSGVWGGIRAMVKGNPDLGLKVLGAIAKGCRDATAGFAEKP